MDKYIIINEKDNVGVALETLKATESVCGITLKQNIPQNHKFALKNINAGENVIKYGFPIGKATENICAGEHIHSHNLKTGLKNDEDYVFSGCNAYSPVNPSATFMGFKRADGNVGTRNRVLIIPTVGCANSAALKIGEQCKSELGNDNFLVLTHPYGCSQLGEDGENTAKFIGAMCHNPNFGGCLLISLGCENNNLSVMEKYVKDLPNDRFKTLNMQNSADEIAEGVNLAKEIFGVIKNDIRTPQTLDKLTVGFKCGGSDGLSGITANPLCGKICDKLTSQGGKAILTEVPEMFGAETALMGRAENKDVFEKCVVLINSFKKYFTDHSQVIYENPSPGNKEGGITTLEEKSLGCITKGGASVITDVLGLYDQCQKKGLSLLWGPGNDIVSTANLAAAGANILIFTTGRGTPLGGAVPTIKLSTNTALFEKKKKWLDYNAGVLAQGENSESVAEDFMQYIIKIANGEKTLNEINGNEEIAIFKDGVTL